MEKKNFKYIYGPVPSWRLGRSLGIDPVSQANKICGFDCGYCQLGSAAPRRNIRRVFVPTREILREIRQLPAKPIDYLTFSGKGEPALAKNLGELIGAVKRMRSEPVAVITNSSLLSSAAARRDLNRADLVMAKLDAGTVAGFKIINRPHRTITFSALMRGLRRFRRGYRGIFALQIMFVEQNRNSAAAIAGLAAALSPDIVYINTPLRPCGCAPLSISAMRRIKHCFTALRLPVVSVYDRRSKPVLPMNRQDTLSRRGLERRPGSRGIKKMRKG
jgi:wyosine [tRNA(Phe)-imidazoG37] synthetase (radical SAM superfamily)